MSEFIDVINKPNTPASAAYGIAGEFPIDWRFIPGSLAVLGQLCDNGWVYDGMFPFIGGTFYVVEKLESPSVWDSDGNIKNYKSVYYEDATFETPVDNDTEDGTTVYTPKRYWFKPYSVEISGVEVATEAEKLTHKVSINGHESYLSSTDSTFEIGRLVPELIQWADVETTTNCGMFYGTNSGQKFALLVEKMGNDQYKRTLSIYNGNDSTVETAFGTATSGHPLTWIGQSSSVDTIGEITSELDGTVTIDCLFGSASEKWCFSKFGQSITASGSRNRTIITGDNKEFTVTDDISGHTHPFLIKLHNGGTAVIVSLVANSTHHGQVKLLDSINDDSDATNGVAATPKAVATINEHLTDHTTEYATDTNFGHVKLSDDIDDYSDVSSHKAATPNAVATVNAIIDTHRTDCNDTDGKASDAYFGHVKLSDATDSDQSVSDHIAATPISVKKVQDRLTITNGIIFGGSNVFYGDVTIDTLQRTIVWKNEPTTVTENDIFALTFVKGQYGLPRDGEEIELEHVGKIFFYSSFVSTDRSVVTFFQYRPTIGLSFNTILEKTRNMYIVELVKDHLTQIGGFTYTNTFGDIVVGVHEKEWRNPGWQIILKLKRKSFYKCDAVFLEDSDNQTITDMIDDHINVLTKCAATFIGGILTADKSDKMGVFVLDTETPTNKFPRGFRMRLFITEIY